MPEGTTEETTAPETAAPEAAEPTVPEAAHATGVQEPAPEAEEQPAPDLSDALSELRGISQRLDRAGIPGPEDDQPLAPLFGQAEEDYGYDDFEQQGQEGGQPQLSEEEQQAQQFQSMLDQAAARALEPHLYQQEMSRREDGIRAFADENPQISEPEVMDRVEATLGVLDPNFGQQGYIPDPRVVRTAYLAVQAELASSGQTSTGPAGSEQGTAEAVGQGGATLETGAGPSAPPAELDPQEQAYVQALSGGGKPNRFGF